jgi:sphinganine C4-monooxygenase
MVPWEGYVSDEAMGTFAPIVLCWVYAGGYQLVLHRRPLQRYRLHTQAEEDEKNLVTVPAVIRGVLLQQLVQAIVAMILFMVTIQPAPLPLPFLIISKCSS